ncbi:MAG TPA: methyltransferase [Chloroflexota bacterium]|jgi:trans-aconitate methyltransferase|nr:methyltransferase [Chloroflexota bacterium]
MDNAPDAKPAWSEEHSRQFIDLGRVFTPSRQEIRNTLLDLIPAAIHEPFLAVELGVGEGWLCEAILERFPASRVLGLDGSATMLGLTAERLQRYAGRFELQPFRLEERRWRTGFDSEVRCIVSSLVVHHLDGAGKRMLYRDLYNGLAAGGALLLADVVAPTGDWERRHMAQSYDAIVQQQSLSMTGSLDAYRQFVATNWNLFAHPDPMDMPSTVVEHLTWLADAGFTGVSVFWLHAGHAVYGGYKPSAV